MATLRLGTSLLLRTSRSSIPCSARRITARPLPATPRTRLRGPKSQWRFYSQEATASKMYTFEDVKELAEKPDPNRILIDSREPGELEQSGTIPGALNIPVKSQPDSFFITAEEFEDRFGFVRPTKDQEVVFYCRSGVRSRAAAELARQAGWEKIGEYQGSWLDWEKNGGPVGKS